MSKDKTPRDFVDGGNGSIRRRTFIKNAIAGAVAPPLIGLMPRTAAAQTRSVSIASYGGSFNEGLKSSVLDPFEKKTGIKVNLGAGASLALAKLQASSSGAAQWDIVELTGAEYQLAVRTNLLMPLDYSAMDVTHVPAEYRPAYGLKYIFFIFVMAWDTRKISAANAPKSWADFWDTKKYPGKRSLYSNIADGCILEGALLADGVAIKDLYPLDIERALKSLDRLGKQNIIWHSTNAEPIQQLTSGEVALATSWNGRIIRAARGGAPVAFTPDQAGSTGDYLVIPKTSKNSKEAFELINYIASDAEAGGRLVEALTDATANTEAIKYVSKELADTLPTNPALARRVFFRDDAWWADNLEKTSIRFKQWLLER
jgi:putative spermidine/putrescine transport system substrate-binding protein